MSARKPSAAKQALIDEAGALGIAVKGKTEKQLSAAIAKAKAGPAETPEVKLGGKAPGKDAKEVDVIDANGVIRTYSLKEHGKDFRKHADEFAGKVEGRKVVAAA